MKKISALVAIALAGVFAVQANAEEDTKEADTATVQQAVKLLHDKQPARVIEILAPLLTRFDERIGEAQKKGMAFCGPSMMEAILYSGLSASEKKDGVVFGPEVCQAYFFNAYALMETGNKAEALATLQRLTALAPMHGHYFVEMGYAYRVNGRNADAEAAYKSALGYADFAEDAAAKKFVRASAQRGLGYLLVESGDLVGAEKAYRKSLKDEPDSPVAKSELQFIAEQRKKK